jgi:hypothetical protein
VVRVTQKNRPEKICKQHFVDLAGFNPAAPQENDHKPTESGGLPCSISSAAPLTAAPRADGIRFVVIDGAPLGAPDPQDARDTPAGARLPGAVLLYNRPELVVYQIPG